MASDGKERPSGLTLAIRVDWRSLEFHCSIN